LAPLYITQLLDCINLALLGQNKEDNPGTMPWAFIVTDYNDITVIVYYDDGPAVVIGYGHSKSKRSIRDYINAI